MSLTGEEKRDACKYEPSIEKDVVNSISRLKIRTADFVFVDVGCGKGKAVIIADRFGFSEIVGVDIDEDLCRVARRNVKKRGIRDAKIVHSNILEYSMRDRDTVFYLFHPFQRVTLERFLRMAERIEAKVYVIYVNARHRQVFAEPRWVDLGGRRIKLFRKAEGILYTDGEESVGCG